MNNDGAFAFLDCLGFKGVWRNREVSLNELLDFLIKAEKQANTSPTITSLQDIENVECSLVFISDSIAISVRYKLQPSHLSPETADGLLVLIAVLLSTELCKEFAKDPLALMLRGNITFGSHITKGAFLIGEAVDDAVTMAETTQGAYIWLSPKAQRLCRNWLNYQHISNAKFQLNLERAVAVQRMDQLFSINQKVEKSLMMYEEAKKNREWWGSLNGNQKASVAREWLYQIVSNSNKDALLPDYPMEMKVCGNLYADVVNPFSAMHPDEHADWIQKILSRFPDLPIDVLMKKQNTARFLTFASEHTTLEFNRKMVLMKENRLWLTSTTGVPFPM